MKALVFILSVYLLGLCFYSCSEDKCDDHSEVEVTASQAQSHEEQDEEEACTPFCFDSCCPSHVICQSSFIQVPAGHQFNEKPNDPYAVWMIAEVPFAISTSKDLASWHVLLNSFST